MSTEKLKLTAEQSGEISGVWIQITDSYLIQAWRINECAIRFKVQEVRWHIGDEPQFRKKGWKTSADVTPISAEAEATVEGTLKWDGCCDYERPAGLTHVCGFDTLQAELEMWRGLYELGAKIMEHVDYLEQLEEDKAMSDDEEKGYRQAVKDICADLRRSNVGQGKWVEWDRLANEIEGTADWRLNTKALNDV